ncbi:MAG: DUF4388 domain-containing protein [bacterium]|nr:MAG: DUF4388 domain-containing protein [bacterium]
MNNLIIYLLDENYREEIERLLPPPDYIIKMVDDLSEVISGCQTDLVDLILVWPANNLAVADLQVQLKKNNLESIPYVVVVRKPQMFQELLNSRCLDIIQIPIPQKEFLLILNKNLKLIHAPSTNSSPEEQEKSVENSNLLNSLDRLNQNRENALITVTQSGHSGRIYVNQGEIVRANFRALESVDALKKMVGLFEADTMIHLTDVQEESATPAETTKVLRDLKNFFAEQQRYIAGTVSPQETLWIQDEDSIKIYSPEDSKRQILELCRKGESLYQLLMIMNQDNLEILNNVNELLQKRILLSDSMMGAEEKEQPKRSILSRIFKRIGKIFKKSPQNESPGKTEFEARLDDKPSIDHLEQSSELMAGEGELDSDTRAKIDLYFKEIYQ